MTSRLSIGLALAVALIASGCATKKFVRTEIETLESELGTQVEGVATQVEENQVKLAEHEGEINEASGTAQEALDRALAAGKLAEGKFLYETVLTDDQVRFEFDQAELGQSAAAALDEFAERLKSEDANVFVEIQGHTDSTGSEEYNLMLGERRAEAVRRYLSSQHGLALHRMSVISYGETAPIAPNDSLEGRSSNRRVSLVVLK